jgi:UrcA family protein
MQRRAPESMVAAVELVITRLNPECILADTKESPVNTMSTANRFHSLIATALFSAISFSFAALPATADIDQVTVKLGDLDVSSPQGAAVLYNRIRAAAKQVCSPLDSAGLDTKRLLRACVNETIEDAVIKLNEPALIAVYSAKTGKTLPTRVASLPNR